MEEAKYSAGLTFKRLKQVPKRYILAGKGYGAHIERVPTNIYALFKLEQPDPFLSGWRVGVGGCGVFACSMNRKRDLQSVQ